MAPTNGRTPTDIDSPAGDSAGNSTRAAAVVAQSSDAAQAEKNKKQPKDNALFTRLFEEGYSFDFFQAVRILEKLITSRQPVGRRGPVNSEVVRFRALLSLNFPPSQIYDIARPTRKFPTPTMVVSFLGLTGPSGMLPRHYTEMLMNMSRRRKDKEKNATRDWFDLFNHRLISLFYRAWEKYRFYIPYERREYDHREPDTFTRALSSLVGIGTDGLQQKLRVKVWNTDEAKGETVAAVDDLSLMFYGGLLTQRTRNAIGLKSMLEDYFQLPVEIKQFQGQWLQLETENQTQLGSKDGNSVLGESMVCGQRVWDVQSNFRIRIGPLDYDRFVEFLPDQSPTKKRKAFFLLVHLVRMYVGPEFDFDIQLILRRRQVSEPQLTENAEPGARLGWNTWLITEPPEDDVESVILQGEEVFWLNPEERLHAHAQSETV